MLYSGQYAADSSVMTKGRVTLVLAFCAMLAVSAVLIALTYLISLKPQSIPLEWQWNLRWEHNFAAWWTGSLLALACVLGLDNARNAPTQAIRRGWTVLSLILLFLGLDEIGSLHERMGVWSEALGGGTWALAIPLGIIIAIMSIRAGWSMLMHGGKERVQIIILAFGFAVLLSVAVQEYFEHAVDWNAMGLKPLRAMIEEGSELVGVAIVLIAVGLPLWNAPRSALSALPELAKEAMVRALALAIPLLLISSDLDPDRGYPSDWLASALFIGAGFLWLRQVWTGDRWLGPLLLAGLCVLASLGSVALGYDESIDIAGFEIARRAVVYSALAAALFVFASPRSGMMLLIPAIALVLLASMHPLMVFACGTLCGLATFWTTSGMLGDQNGMSSSRSS